jgi:hypothetical protein
MISKIEIALMIEAVNTSETSVNFYETTQRNIPKDDHFHIRRREIISYWVKTRPVSCYSCNFIHAFANYRF